MKLVQFVLESSTSIEERTREHYKEENRPISSWDSTPAARVGRLAKLAAEMLLKSSEVADLRG
jgi:hypothetical protein